MGTYRAHEGKVMEIIWSHGLPWIFKRETSPGFVLKIGDVVERSKQHLWRTFFWWNIRVKKKTRDFMTSSRNGNLRDSTFPKKKDISQIQRCFCLQRIYACENPTKYSSTFCVGGNFLDLGKFQGWGGEQDASVVRRQHRSWSFFGANLDLRKAGLWRDSRKWGKNHSWLFLKRPGGNQWNSKSTTHTLEFLTAHPFEKGEKPKKEKVPLANDHFSGVVALNFCGNIISHSVLVLVCFTKKRWWWSSNTDNQQQIFSSYRRSGPPWKNRGVYSDWKKTADPFLASPALILVITRG